METTAIDKIIQVVSASACFLLVLFFDPDDGSDIFLRNTKLFPDYVALQPR
jgi:hypothetical protein